MSQKPMILVVGGGPVGLMTAFFFLKQGPPVFLAEKKPFTRKQIVHLDAPFWNVLPAKVKEQLIKNGACHFKTHLVCVVPPPASSESKEMMVELLENDEVRINIVMAVLQTYLLQYMLDTYGSTLFHVVQEQITLENVHKQFPGRIVVVADGGGSNSLGAALWYATTNYSSDDAEDVPYETIHLGSSAIYTFDSPISNDTLTASEGLKYVTMVPQRAFGALRALPHYFYIGSQVRDSTRETVLEEKDPQKRLQLFSTFPEGRFLNDVTLKLGINPSETKDFNFQIFSLDLRAAKQFYYEAGGKAYFIAGDAAFTTHFFTGRGMNSGLRSGKYIVDLVGSAPSSTWCSSYSMQLVKLIMSVWSKVPDVLFDVQKVYEFCEDVEQQQQFDECVMSGSVASPSPLGGLLRSKIYATI